MRFLFVDRILEANPAYVQGLKQISQDDTFLTVDKKGNTCFIPSLIGETLGQLAAWQVMRSLDFQKRPVAGIVDEARLIRPAYVGETLHLEAFIESLDDEAVQYSALATVGNKEVFRVNGALGPLVPMDDFIGQEEAALQFKQIYRPGTWVPREGALIKGNACKTINLSFDRIVSCLPNESIVGEKIISLAAPFFKDHFPRKPVLPLTVLLECQRNLLDAFLKASDLENYSLQSFQKIKMSDFVQPGDAIETTLKVRSKADGILRIQAKTEREGKRVCVAELWLTEDNHD